MYRIRPSPFDIFTTATPPEQSIVFAPLASKQFSALDCPNTLFQRRGEQTLAFNLLLTVDRSQHSFRDRHGSFRIGDETGLRCVAGRTLAEGPSGEDQARTKNCANSHRLTSSGPIHSTAELRSARTAGGGCPHMSTEIHT